MKHAAVCIFTLAALQVALGAGAMGHNALGSIAVDRILNGTYSAPPELKEALANPKVRRAFLGGSVGPDLFPTKTHRGSQSDFTQHMIGDAWRQYRAAGSDPAAREKASESLGFAYGWLCHTAVDLNAHPKINGIVGDTYDYNDSGGKATHAALEAQLYAYLRRVAGAKDPYEAEFPADFVARELGVEPGELKRAISRLRIIAAGEIASANQVTLTDKQLKDAWSEVVRQGMLDTKSFVEKPRSFENWDLDCGKISTEDFEWLRKAMMQLNGGTLPADWGKRYLDYWKLVKDMPPGDRMAKLEAALGKGGGAISPGHPAPVPATAKFLASQPMNLFVKVDRDWVFPTRMHYPDSQIRWDGAHFSVAIRFEEPPFTKDVRIEGEIGEGEIAYVRVSCSQTTADNSGFVTTSALEARHIPIVPGGLMDEYVGDVTFAANSDSQAPAFTGSFKASSGTGYVWDKSTMPGWSKERRSYPIVTVRFRLKKYG